jgi:hypothetical protein
MRLRALVTRCGDLWTWLTSNHPPLTDPDLREEWVIRMTGPDGEETQCWRREFRPGSDPAVIALNAMAAVLKLASAQGVPPAHLVATLARWLQHRGGSV